MLASEIEALPDLSGYLKLASAPVWMRLDLPLYDVPAWTPPFVHRAIGRASTRPHQRSMADLLRVA